MAALPDQLTISDLAARSGVAPSALRYYETLGLISSGRSAGNQRRYTRGTLRRVAIIRVAQSLGLPLAVLGEALSSLPQGHEPSAADWEQLSSRWRSELEERIATLELLRDELSSCIGCGCLSLERCGLFNQGDRAARKGAGPRYLLGDRASDAD
ncbi:MAG: redox-sensitive transcriptional activator SoxR [Tepidiformaceae bacterium]